MIEEILKSFSKAVLDPGIKEEHRWKYHFGYCLEGLKIDIEKEIQKQINAK